MLRALHCRPPLSCSSCCAGFYHLTTASSNEYSGDWATYPAMLHTCSVSMRLPAACRSLQAASSPRAAATARVWQPRPPQAAHSGAPRPAAGRRRSLAARAQHREEEQGASAVGHDLGWSHVARDVRARLAATAGSKQSLMDQLQGWLGEADLRQRGESDVEEHSQAEVVAAEEASRQGLDHERLDVQAWLGSEGDAERDAKMAGALVMRLLQAYHKEAGEPFDDEQEDSYWRLQGFIPGSLVEALDHDTLKRLVKGYLSLPFSGV
ncbi:hypothetical protein ABPG75_005919 [Micractinium tetrahymenae]